MPSRLQFDFQPEPTSPRRTRGPLRLLLMGDFSARAANERPPLASRPIHRLDADSFDTVMDRSAERFTLRIRDLATGKVYRSRPLVHWRKLVKGKFIAPGNVKVPVVPLRFVQACPNGHISDIDWYGFVHAGKPPLRAQLWIDQVEVQLVARAN